MHHPFPNGLAAGTLPLKCFLHFIQQDYHFLKVRPPVPSCERPALMLSVQQYGRTNALAAYKTEDMVEMAASMEITNAVIKETEMHVQVRPSLPCARLSLTSVRVQYCEKYGISRAELLAVPESVTCVAYTRFVLDVAAKGDLLDARVVTYPCLLGYGHVGKRLVAQVADVDRSDANPYWGWIKEYGGDWYQGAVKTGTGELPCC